MDAYKTLFKTLVIPTILYVIALIIVKFIDRYETSYKSMIIVTCIIIISSCFGALTAAYIYSDTTKPLLSNTEKELKDLKTSITDKSNEFMENISIELNSFKSSLVNGLIKENLIIQEPFLVELEKIVQCKEILLTTPDLKKDSEQTIGIPVMHIVENNIINRNISYTYLVPNNNAIKTRIRHLKSRYMKYEGIWGNKLIVKELDSDRWKRLPVTNSNFIVYNATNSKGGVDCHYDPMQGFSELPIGGDNRYIWIRIDINIVEEWIGLIDDMTKDIPMSLLDH